MVSGWTLRRPRRTQVEPINVDTSKPQEDDKGKGEQDSSILYNYPRGFATASGDDPIAKEKREKKMCPIGQNKQNSVIGNLRELKIKAAKELQRIEKNSRVNCFEKGPKSVSLFWQDTLFLWINFFQIQGLVWLLGRAWAWPTSFLKMGSFSLFFNLDFWSVWQFLSETKERAPDSFTLYAGICLLMFLCAPALMLLVVLLNREKVRLITRGMNSINIRFWIVRLGEIMIVPSLLLFTRGVSCQHDNLDHVVEFVRQPELRPQFQCWTTLHGTAIGLSAPLFIICCVIVPVVLFRRISWAKTTCNPAKHERYLVQKEMEWLLQITPEWFVDNLRHMSSFRSAGSYYWLLLAVRRVVFVVFVIWFRLDPRGLGVALGCLFFFSSVWFLLLCPFRYAASNRLASVLDATVCAQLYLGAQNSIGVRNALTIGGNLNRILFAITVGGVSTAAILLPVFLFLEKRMSFHKAPSFAQFVWPTNKDSVRQTLGDAMACEWIQTIHRARTHLQDHRLTQDFLFPVHETFKHIEQLEKVLEQAKKKQSILVDTIEDTIEECCAVLDVKKRVSVFPNAKLQDALPRLTQLAHKRQKETILMNPTKANILRKLKVLSIWAVNHSKEAFWPQQVLDAEKSILLAKVDAALRVPMQDLDLELLGKLRHRLRGMPQDSDSVASIAAIDDAIYSKFRN